MPCRFDGVAVMFPGAGSVLDTVITGIDQRTPLCIGSANEVGRFNTIVLGK